MPGEEQHSLEQAPAADSAQRPVYQRKATLFRVLSLLWFFPTGGAAVILALGIARARRTACWDELLGGIRFEHWIALGVLAAHGAFFRLARHYRRTEPFREAPGETAELPVDRGRTD